MEQPLSLLRPALEAVGRGRLRVRAQRAMLRVLLLLPLVPALPHAGGRGGSCRRSWRHRRPRRLLRVRLFGECRDCRRCLTRGRVHGHWLLARGCNGGCCGSYRGWGCFKVPKVIFVKGRPCLVQLLGCRNMLHTIGQVSAPGLLLLR